MDAEERTATAIEITRGILKKALDSPFTIVTMTKGFTNPDHIEDEVERILCYLEKTKHKKVQSEWAKGISKETVVAAKYPETHEEAEAPR